MSIRKTIIVTAAIAASVAMVAPTFAGAATVEELMAQLATLQAQLAALQGTGTTGGTTTIANCAGITFTRNMTVGATGSDVKCLQSVLNAKGFTVSATGAGSPGAETTYFGSKTLAAVKLYQAAKGFVPANQVGPLTRGALNADLATGGTPGTTLPEGCTSTSGFSPITGQSCGGGTSPSVPPTPAGALSVALSSDTPASATIADATNANFTKFSLTAGSGEVSITRIYVTRAGLSANGDVENIKVVEADTGTYRGTTASLNADNRAMITFTPALKIPANTTKSFFIRAGIVDNTAAGKTVTLGIASNSDITSNATSVSGAPAIGNAMTTVLLTVGSLSIVEDGGLTDSTPDAGDTNVAVNQFKLTAGSTESVTVETITVLKSGTADLSDTANIELYDVTHNKTLATQAAWDNEEKATFTNLNLTIAKGESLRLKVLVDIVGGVESTALTVNADVVDGTDTLVVAKGNTYGFYITPTRTGSWDGLGTAQTINAGSLTITKSSATPATGNVSVGDDVVLAKFAFDAKGEEIRITSLTVETTIDGTIITYDEVTNVRIFDENGNIVAGPNDVTDAAASNDDYVTFTDTIIVPIGVHTYTVKAKIADTVTTGGTIMASINDPDSTTRGITAKGMTSGDTITVNSGGADVDANTLTVAGGAMVVTTLTTPVASNVARGTADFIWGTASLSAASSGEDVQVTSITVNDDTDSNSGTNGDPDDIDNAELWADLTTANSSRGDAYETKISDTENLTGDTNDATNAKAFALTQTITVPKGGFIKVALVADINASASVSADVHTFTFTAGTFTGATSGEDITETASGSGQAMTVTTSGTLTISSPNTPASDIVVSGETATLFVLRLTEGGTEALDVDDITFMVTGGDSVDTYYLYNGSAPVGSASSGTAPKFVFSDGTITVPKNSYTELTLKGKLVDKDSTTNNTTITAGIEGDNLADSVNCTGIASGAEADSDAQVASGNGMDLYKSRPTFAAKTSYTGQTLQGAMPLSASSLVAIYDVTANANEDITFEASGSSSASGYLVFNIDRVQNDTVSGANTWSLYDGSQTLLDTASVTDGDKEVKFDFADSAFRVEKGTTKQLWVYGDTSEFEDNGDQLQIYLNDSNADTYIEWSINNSGDYNEGNYIFRGDIRAGMFNRTVSGS